MPTPRWTRVSDSAYTWEADAIDWLAGRLPDSDAWQGWSNLEFVAQDGSVNEVDALVLTPTKLLLIEIKSTPATVSGDAGPWTWQRANGSREVTENPLVLANRKAKRLAGLLKNTKALKGKGAPWVEELVLLGHKDTRVQFTGPAGTRVFLRSAPHGSERDLAAYIAGCAHDGSDGPFNWAYHSAVVRGIEELGIRKIQRQFVAGQWRLAELLEDAGVYQEYEGVHTKVEGSRRRVRVYPWPATGPETGRRARLDAAKREFRLLDRGDMHPGILQAQSLEETERGPAVVFEHPLPAERLDTFLVRRGGALDLRQRLRLVREIAETIQWAHGQGLHHRTLTPSAVLVIRPDDDSPVVKIRNWQVGSLPEATISGQTITWHDFVQVGLAGRDEDAVYLAPELRGGGKPDPALLDVFSLGALAWHILTGRAPAASPEELLQRLTEHQGLRLSAVLDGVDADLEALVHLATSPDLADRPSATEFLGFLEESFARLAAADAEATPGTSVHPLDAEQGAELDGGFRVLRRLGSGSTALALLVEREGMQGVLKVARDPQLNDRLRQEGEVLRRLRNQHIVELHEVVEVGGHVALFMELAGERTLAERLAREGALSLDLLQRFGDELLAVVDWLEQQAIPHRDLKPENIGVGETAKDRRLTLRLFDFSLATTPADNLRAGTPGYLDPFLEERKTKRWDASAERYAAAVTLHEMATGALPTWGDGRQHPMTLPADATPVLAVERLDPAVREPLGRFFARALARDPAARFDTAEAMRAAWQGVFHAIDLPATATTSTTGGGAADALAAIGAAELATPLAVLGLTPRVLNALERLGVHDLRGLAEFPRTKLFGNSGIGARTVREIRDLADAAARRVAELGAGEQGSLLPLEPVGAEAEAAVRSALAPEVWHAEMLVQRVVLAGKLSAAEARAIRLLTGYDAPAGAEGADLWPSTRDVAEAEGLPRAAVLEYVEKARVRWGKRPEMTALREDVARLLEQHGGVATREELARALARVRGTTSETPADQVRNAGAALWAALEVEASREKGCRYRLQRGDRVLLIVATAGDGSAVEALADPAAVRGWVEQLSSRADLLADVDPPLPPARLLEELQSIPVPEGIAAPSPDRLLRLAVAAAEHAALTPRQELYRRGLAAQRAVMLGAGSLLGAQVLDERQVRERIAARFPEAQPLPPRPALDDLLRAALVPLVWDDGARKYVVPRSSVSGTSTGSRTGTSGATTLGTLSPVDPAVEEAEALDQRVRAVVDEGRFLVLTVEPSRHASVEAVLRDRFGFEALSLERLVLDALRAEAAAIKAQWPVVLDADAAGSGTADGRRLAALVQRVRPRVAAALAELERPTLLLHPGLLGRYDLLGVLDALQDRARRGPGVVALVPADGQDAMPRVDERALPVVHASDWARVPPRWSRRSIQPA